MAEIKLIINGKTKKFDKKQFFIKEHILALQFSLKQEKYLKKEDRNIEDIAENQKNWAEFMSDVFEKQFTVEEFINGLEIKDKSAAEDIYIECLGGKNDEEKKENQ
ncbi:hypothetical protein [Carnobacterium sp. ISL-102]|uniref:phage tail assembly chaperone G n=1 Tax=Carnobacterium sp. ISL-102 TaxID=2819142 RepID=UPI001BECEA24|nr:hypothetical protein [Carnobacterium sp. ISL-102]MBT2732120.1 hypothetical protein [Carnobacterium sp. ISL-102]